MLVNDLVCAIWGIQIQLVKTQTKLPNQIKKLVSFPMKIWLFPLPKVTCIRGYHKIEIQNIQCVSIFGSEENVAHPFPAGNYMFKVNNRNTRTRC